MYQHRDDLTEDRVLMLNGGEDYIMRYVGHKYERYWTMIRHQL